MCLTSEICLYLHGWATLEETLLFMSQLWDLREITTSTSPRTNESFIFARENKTSSLVAETIDGAASPNLDTYHPPPFTDCKTFFTEIQVYIAWNLSHISLKQTEWGSQAVPFIPVAFLLMQAKILCFIVFAGINKPVNCSSFGLGFFLNAIEFRAVSVLAKTSHRVYFEHSMAIIQPISITSFTAYSPLSWFDWGCGERVQSEIRETCFKIITFCNKQNTKYIKFLLKLWWFFLYSILMICRKAGEIG